MGQSTSAKRTKTRILAGVFDRISESQVETLEILADVDQMTQLMTSLMEAKSGQVVSFDSAFADL